MDRLGSILCRSRQIHGRSHRRGRAGRHEASPGSGCCGCRCARQGRAYAEERATILRRARDLLEKQRELYTEVLVAETGFTRADAAGEIDRSLVTLELSAEEGKRLVGDMVPFAASPGHENRIGFTMRFPLGVVCAITPFNSPLNTVLHKVAPAFAAGNAVILKPSD